MASSENMRVFITGSTGDVGAQVLPILEKASVSTRLLLRSQQQVDEIKKSNEKSSSNTTEAILGDLTTTRVDELSLEMRGCSTLLLLTPVTPNQLQQNKNAIDAVIMTLTSTTGETSKDGVKWIIRLSASDRRPTGNVPWAVAHHEADRYLEEQATKYGIAWTVVAPSAFMSNILELAPAIKSGFMPQASGDGKAGWVNTKDVSEVCAQIVQDGPARHGGKTYTLTGPKLINFYDIAATLEAALGYRVRYIDLPGPVFGLLLRYAAGLDAWYAKGLVAQFAEIIKRHDEGINGPSADVKAILGREPGSFEQWVERNKGTFEGGKDLGPAIGIGAAGVGVGIAVLGVAVAAWARSRSR